MSIQWESSNSDLVTADADTSLVITKPTGLAAGDLLVFIGGTASGLSYNTPSGWTSQVASDTANGNIQVLSKVADSSDAAASNFTFNISGTFSQGCGSLHRVSGASTNAPTSATGTGANDTTQTCPTITTPTDNCLVFWAVYRASNFGPCSGSKGTERTDIGQASPACALAVYSNLEVTAGSITGVVITSTNFGAKRLVSVAWESSGGGGGTKSPPVFQRRTRFFKGRI